MLTLIFLSIGLFSVINRTRGVKGSQALVTPFNLGASTVPEDRAA